MKCYVKESIFLEKYETHPEIRNIVRSKVSFICTIIIVRVAIKLSISPPKLHSTTSSNPFGGNSVISRIVDTVVATVINFRFPSC